MSSFYSNVITWLITRAEWVWNTLVYSSAYLALIAMVEVALATVLLSLPLNAAPVVVGLVTFAVYTTDRIADVETDVVSNPRQAAYVRRQRDLLYVLASLAYGFAVALSVLGGPLALAITLVPGLFWVLYASEWVPRIGLHFQRLKEVFVVNSLVVAVAWAVTLTFLPLAFAHAAITPTAGLVFAYFLLRSFVDTEIPNVRDVEGDRAIDVATIPVVLGVRRTRHALYGVDVLTFAVVGYAVSNGYFEAALGVGLAVGLLYSLSVTSFLGRAANDELVAIAAECEYLLVGAILVLVTFGL